MTLLHFFSKKSTLSQRTVCGSHISYVGFLLRQKKTVINYHNVQKAKNPLQCDVDLGYFNLIQLMRPVKVTNGD